MIRKLDKLSAQPARKNNAANISAAKNNAADNNPKKKAAQTHFRVVEKDLPEFSFRTRLIDNAAELESLIGAWNRLTEVALRPNLFFDPGFLIPAFKHLNDGSVRVLVIDAPNRVHPDGPRVLCGLLPVASRRFYGIPMSCLEIWKHDQCFDCTPLIRRDCAPEVLTHLLNQLGPENKTSLLSLDTIAGDGEFLSVLTEVLHQSGLSVFQRDAFNRACFIPMDDAETFIKTKVAKSTRKNTQRLERKLRSEGAVDVSVFTREDSQAQWIEDFLTLEQSGWKGNSRTALASQADNRTFFVELAERLFASQKLSMLKVSFNDRPVCILCDIHQDDYAIAFKIAFDESFAEYSPGLIAELHNIHYLHESAVRMMDSCADPNHSMINRVWKDRTRYQSLVVALRGQCSRFAVASMPLLQTTCNLFRKTGTSR